MRAGSSPVKLAAPADADELDGFLEHLTREVHDPALREVVERILGASMTDDIRTQDAPYLLARSTTNRGQGPKVWRFIAEHWAAMQDRFASSNIIGLVSGIRYLTDPESVEDVDSQRTARGADGPRRLAGRLPHGGALLVLGEECRDRRGRRLDPGPAELAEEHVVGRGVLRV